MAAITGRSELAVNLCKALGQDPTKVRAIKINMDVETVVTATLTMYVDQEELERVVTACERVDWNIVAQRDDP